MAAEVDQDVDAVLADQRRHLVIGEPRGRAPVVGQSLEPARVVVRVRRFGVAVEFDLPAVMLLQHRLDEVTRGAGGEVGRDIADTQATLRVRIIGPIQPGRQPPPGVGLIPQAKLLEHLLAGEAGLVAEAEQHRPMAGGVVRSGRKGLAEDLQGLFQSSLVLKRAGEVEADVGDVRPGLHRLAQVLLGRGHQSTLHQRQRPVVVRLGEIGPDHQRLGEGGLALQDPVLGDERIAEAVEGGGAAWIGFKALPGRRGGLVQPPQPPVHVGQLRPAIGVLRQTLQMPGDETRRLRGPAAGLQPGDQGVVKPRPGLGGRLIFAPLPPELAEGGLEMPCEIGGVVEGRGLEAGSQAGPELGQCGEVAAGLHGPGDIVGFRVAGPVCEAHAAQDRGPEAAHRGPVLQG